MVQCFKVVLIFVRLISAIPLSGIARDNSLDVLQARYFKCRERMHSIENSTFSLSS